MLNFKDMLDIVDLLNTPENPELSKLTSFFSIFDCMQSQELFSFQGLMQNNFNISEYFQKRFGIWGKLYLHKFYKNKRILILSFSI